MLSGAAFTSVDSGRPDDLRCPARGWHGASVLSGDGDWESPWRVHTSALATQERALERVWMAEVPAAGLPTWATSWAHGKTVLCFGTFWHVLKICV